MTEEEWLNATDLELMWRQIQNNMSERKTRLFACMCCRRLWNLLDGAWPAGIAAIEVVERFVDGLAIPSELEIAQFNFKIAHNQSNHRLGVRDPLEPIRYLFPSPDVSHHQTRYAAWAARRVIRKKERSEEFRAQVNFFRDVFGNPFYPVTVEPSWLIPKTLVLAQAAYDERILPAGTLDPDRLSVLADALEDADCTEAAILDHLRGPWPHVRGCWSVDLLLGKK